MIRRKGVVAAGVVPVQGACIKECMRAGAVQPRRATRSGGSGGGEATRSGRVDDRPRARSPPKVKATRERDSIAMRPHSNTRSFAP